ncbi:hypothetical protein F4780DRAFT_796156 [Xylariomycetidae sp. FL0641]|nr:hypothetical protein F4780DRAFT_796156 [Xylariomycetidae sp. FL0641]
MARPPPRPRGEQTVHPSTPLPAGYVFVPRGDAYVTRHCRSATLAAGQALYAVADPRHRARTLGLRVPAAVARAVQQARGATADARARATRRRDARLEARLAAAVRAAFPRVPAADCARVVARAAEKGARRVGRAAKVDETLRATLAVRAHVRHVHTRYDRLLRQEKVPREEARQRTMREVDEKCRDWGWVGKMGSGKVREKAKGKPGRRVRKEERRGRVVSERQPKANGKELPVRRNPATAASPPKEKGRGPAAVEKHPKENEPAPVVAEEQPRHQPWSPYVFAEKRKKQLAQPPKPKAPRRVERTPTRRSRRVSGDAPEEDGNVVFINDTDSDRPSSRDDEEVDSDCFIVDDDDDDIDDYESDDDWSPSEYEDEMDLD